MILLEAELWCLVDDMPNPNFVHPNPTVFKWQSGTDSKHLVSFQLNFAATTASLFFWKHSVFNGYFQELDFSYPLPHWVNFISPKMPSV